ncbi:MAG: DUF4446 family protein [Actinomycetota bacterium]|nr:DUF4446 family protein [Actinomycetota bacterium]
MAFSSKILTLLVLVALGLDVLALFILASGAGRRRRPPERVPIVMDETLRGILEGHARTMQRLDAAVGRLAAEDARLSEVLAGAVQNVALIRYDAFEDMGGRLSFSCALLDAQGDGVVVTSINGRQDTRVYAKPVRRGTSEYNLSEEEEQAIRDALTGRRQILEAG